MSQILTDIGINATSDEILQSFSQTEIEMNGVVGYYYSGGGSFPVGVGVEATYFRGVDTSSGELVEAYYPTFPN